MDRVHEGVHGPGPQGWSMDLGSMFSIRPKLSCYWMGPNGFKVQIENEWFIVIGSRCRHNRKFGDV